MIFWFLAHLLLKKIGQIKWNVGHGENHMKAIARLLATLVFTAWTGAANAYYLVYSSPGVVAGIGDLDVGGTLYNVDMQAVGDEYSTFGGEELFWDTQGAFAATIAVVRVLDGGTWLLRPDNRVRFAFAVAGDVSTDDAIVGVYAPDTEGSWAVSSNSNVGYQITGGVMGTAWSVAQVPLPAAGWLFLSAIAGLIARKKLVRK